MVSAPGAKVNASVTLARHVSELERGREERERERENERERRRWAETRWLLTTLPFLLFPLLLLHGRQMVQCS
ncbi:hypothetical protein DKP78_18030, partial [Enterococcus faecium]